MSNNQRKLLYKHHAFVSSRDVKEITEPLKKYFNIDYFLYQRDVIDLKTNTKKLCSPLCNHSSLLEYLILDYKHTEPSLYTLKKKDYYFAHAHYPNQLKCLAQDCNIYNGFTRQSRISEDTWEWISFATTSSDSSYFNFYLNNRDLLDKFIVYFKDKAKKIIANSIANAYVNHSKRVVQYYGDDELSTFPNSKENFLHEVSSKRISLLDKSGKEILIPRAEMNCLSLLSRGRSTKEIAANLNISPRTVETNLSRSKLRLKCYTKKELLDILEAQ